MTQSGRSTAAFDVLPNVLASLLRALCRFSFWPVMQFPVGGQGGANSHREEEALTE